MSLKSLARLLPFSRRASSVLVCETDGFTLRGAVISRDADTLTVLHSARSEALDFKAAVAEIIASVRKQGWAGATAVLLTPGALSTLIELPVSPASPRPPEQMLELVRWELEPLLMQHTTLWSVGRILVGLGYLTEAQAIEVLDRQQGRKNGGAESAPEVYSFKRYGEMAIEMGFIDHRQMEECLARQAWFQNSGDDVACGWSAQPAPNVSSADAGHYPWLVCGVNQGMMLQWATAFADNGMLLEHLYPLVGCAATAPELLSKEAGDVLLIEAHAGLVTGLRITAGSVTAINLQQSTLNSTMDACLEAYHALTPPEAKAVWLASAVGESDGLEMGLASMLGHPVDQLTTINGDATPGMVGAARHTLALAGAARCCAVSVQGPKVPLWQKIEVRAIAAGLLLILGLGAAEFVLQLRQNLAEAEHERVTKAAAVMDEAVGKVQVQIDHIKKLQGDLKAKGDEMVQLKNRMDLLAKEVPKRSALVQSLFAELNSTVPDDMVIDSIEETPQFGFKVAAWSLSEKSAQQFVKSFQAAIEPSGLKLMEVTVSSQLGRLGLQGYSLRFRAAKQVDVLPAVAVLGKK